MSAFSYLPLGLLSFALALPPVEAAQPGNAKVAEKRIPSVKKKSPAHAEKLGIADIAPTAPGLHGRASFYGYGFQGRRTATGDVFDVRGYTAASNHYPLGAWVSVRRLDNERCVVVRINDRMHKRNKRIIDLSRGAAQDLDMIAAGVILVHTREIPAAHAENACAGPKPENEGENAQAPWTSPEPKEETAPSGNPEPQTKTLGDSDAIPLVE